MRRCVIVCLLAGAVLGGCGNYWLKQEVKSQYGKPDLVRHVSGEEYDFTLYGQSPTSTLGPVDQEIWYYIHRHLAVIYHGDQYDTRQMSALELLNSQRIHNELSREKSPETAGGRSGNDNPFVPPANPTIPVGQQ